MPKIRVLVVDDAVVMRRLIGEALARDPDFEVVGAAAHERATLARIPQLNPDIVTLDIGMPEMDGLGILREIRKTHPNLPVIVLSTLSERGATATFDALAAGATDYVTKPINIGSAALSLHWSEEELAPKLKLHCRHLLGGHATAPKTSALRSPVLLSSISRSVTSQPIELVCIGSSTGGPNALAAIFGAIPEHPPVPIAIVQPMPALFTRILAERLDKVGGVRFVEGTEGCRLEAGYAYLAPGGRHMEVLSRGCELRLHLHDQPPENSCRPAIDVLFRSVAAACGGRALGAILTGTGRDGLDGCRLLREHGAQILTQDEKSSLVWDLPGAVTHAGLADRVLPLDQMAAEIRRRINACCVQARRTTTVAPFAS